MQFVVHRGRLVSVNHNVHASGIMQLSSHEGTLHVCMKCILGRKLDFENLWIIYPTLTYPSALIIQTQIHCMLDEH